MARTGGEGKGDYSRKAINFFNYFDQRGRLFEGWLFFKEIQYANNFDLNQNYQKKRESLNSSTGLKEISSLIPFGSVRLCVLKESIGECQLIPLINL